MHLIDTMILISRPLDVVTYTLTNQLEQGWATIPIHKVALFDQVLTRQSRNRNIRQVGFAVTSLHQE